MDGYLITAITALCTAVAILWKRSDSSLTWLRKGHDDLVLRVRKLEDDRVISEQRHGADIKSLAKDMLESRSKDREITRHLIDSIKKMPCKVDLSPDRFDIRPTEPIVRKTIKKPKKG